MTLRIVGVAGEPRLKAPHSEDLQPRDTLFQVCQMKDFDPPPNSEIRLWGALPRPEQKAIVLKTPTSNVEVILVFDKDIDMLIAALQGLRAR